MHGNAAARDWRLRRRGSDAKALTTRMIGRDAELEVRGWLARAVAIGVVELPMSITVL